VKGNGDFGSIISVAQAFYASKFKQIEQDHSDKNEKTTLRKKDPKKACAKKWDPYNAPPLTRNNGLQASGSEGLPPGMTGREKQNNRLTLNEENVIYGTSRHSAKARRNCSLTIYQTICVGTQGHGFLNVFGR